MVKTRLNPPLLKGEKKGPPLWQSGVGGDFIEISGSTGVISSSKMIIDASAICQSNWVIDNPALFQ